MKEIGIGIVVEAIWVKRTPWQCQQLEQFLIQI
jgi:hypothetical protein